jgi:AcrR family transcriptional regulator
MVTPQQPGGQHVPTTKGELRRTELIDAAVRCLVREGWPGLTHRKIAQEARSNPGLVHYYFGGASGVRSAVATYACERLLMRPIEETDRCADMEEIVTAFTTMVAIAARRPGDVAVLVQVMIGSMIHAEIATVVRDTMAMARLRFADTLRRMDPAMDAETATRTAALALAATDGVLLSVAVDDEAVAEHYLSAYPRLLRGLLAGA